MNAPLYNMQGEKTGEVALDAAVFAVPVQPVLIQQAIETQDANSRLALAHTKDRSEVSGGGKKPWRQKGTGRARHGSIRSPLWAGGGVTFGPRNTRNYRSKMNIRAKRKALLGTLSEKAAEGKIVVLENIAMDAPKTKTLMTLLKKLPGSTPTLLVLPAAAHAVQKSTANVPDVTTILANSLNVRAVLTAQRIVIARDGLKMIRTTYTKE